MKVDRGLLDETLSTMYGSLKYSKSYLFYAHIIGQCSIKIDKEMPSPAGVAFSIDHYNLYINPEYFDKYNLEERLAILKHEMLHIINLHVQRKDDRVHLPWNIATDCAINQLIDITHLPKDGILPSNMPVPNCPVNESGELYYDLLKQELDKQKSKKCKKCNGTGKQKSNNSNGEGKQEPDESGEGGKTSESGEPSEPCESCNGTGFEDMKGKPFDSHEKWQESQGDSELQADVTKSMLEKSITETAKGRGDVPSEVSDWMNILTRKAELDWKKVLRGIVGNKKVDKRTTIMRRDRRFPGRDDLKGKTKNRLFNLLVVSDVSGSVSDKALIELWGEIRHICDVTKTDIDLIQVDTQAYKPEKLSKKTKVINRKAQGGTVLYPAIDMAKAEDIKYDAVVVTTDGGIGEYDIEKFSEIGKKVIWLIEKTGTVLDSMNTGKMKAFKLKG